MASFRRILLSRLLLLSVPIILLGVSTTYFVTYRKARSGLLETARQNLTESAIRRGKEISNSITALKTNLVSASHHPILRSLDEQEYPEFLARLSQQLPTQIECLQLIDATGQERLANTCDREISQPFTAITWPQQQENSLLPVSTVKIQPIFPENDPNLGTSCTKQDAGSNADRLKLLTGVPIYNEAGRLNAILVARSVILEPTKVEPGSLTGSTAILDRNGTILVHPCGERVGRSIREEVETDRNRLQSILRKARSGEQNFIHLFSFEQKGVELLAGYTGIVNPLVEAEDDIWVVLTMTPLKNALAALDDIERVLVSLLSSLTLGLIVGTIVTILYVSREIASPLEQLIESIHEQDPLQSQEPIPDDFNIYEFRQLARAFNAVLDATRNSYELMNRTLENAVKTSWDLKEAKKQLQESLEAERLANDRLTQTQQKLKDSLQAERLANDRLREFLRCMSDRFRTPLTGLMMNLDLLRDEVQDGTIEIGKENEETLEDAYLSTQKLYDRHEQIAQMFSIAGEQFNNPDIQQVNLTQILRELSEEYQGKIQEKGLDFQSRGWQDTEILIYADPIRLHEVLKALVDNAVTYTHTGSILLNTYIESIEETTEPTDLGNNKTNGNSFFPTGQRACILIQDTGVGISRQKLEKVNNPWKHRMTEGLSIVIAHILMEMMKSTIIFDSEGENKGTTVQLYFPTVKKS
ncbi:MAG: sensor histidine kinase [Cyanobacteria bacterium P01_E01_bin.42]